jgi:hypothetical protein
VLLVCLAGVAFSASPMAESLEAAASVPPGHRMRTQPSETFARWMQVRQTINGSPSVCCASLNRVVLFALHAYFVVR